MSFVCRADKPVAAYVKFFLKLPKRLAYLISKLMRGQFSNCGLFGALAAMFVCTSRKKHFLFLGPMVAGQYIAHHKFHSVAKMRLAVNIGNRSSYIKLTHQSNCTYNREAWLGDVSSSSRETCRCAANLLINSSWPLCIFGPAFEIINQSALSTSGISICLPERGGHSIFILLLLTVDTSKSPRTAQALIIFPSLRLISPKSIGSSWGAGWPVSSSNSLLAAPKLSLLSSYSPLGIDQAPKSFLDQKGPPGCTNKTSV